jgi:hypothetical protein
MTMPETTVPGPAAQVAAEWPVSSTDLSGSRSAPPTAPAAPAGPVGAGGLVGLALALAAPVAAVLVHLVASGAATYVTWIVLVVGLVAWSPVSRRWPRVNRLGPVVALLYLGAGAFLLLSAG